MTRVETDNGSATRTIYSKSAERLLRLLGGNRSYKGFDLTTYAIGKAIENPASLNYICKSLYVDAAVTFHTTIYCAERNIRTIKHVIWDHGDRELLEEIFGSPICQKSPKNAVFIDKLAQYIMEHT